MRDDQHVDAVRQAIRRRATCKQATGQQAFLHAGADVSEQQERVRRRGHAHHTGTVVVGPGSSVATALRGISFFRMFFRTSFRMQELELHSVPSPFLAARAGPGIRSSDLNTGNLNTGGFHISDCNARSVPGRDHRQGSQDCRGTAGVIAIRVAQHQHVDAGQSLVPQKWHHGQVSRRRSAPKRRPRVVEKHVPVSANDHREALAYVEHVNVEVPCGWCRAAGKREGQEESDAEYSQSPGQRHERYERSDDEPAEQPRLGRHQIHEGPGKLCEPLERRPGSFEERGAEPQQSLTQRCVHREERQCGERNWDEQQAEKRYRDQVCERRDEGDRAEQRQRDRCEGDRDRRLRAQELFQPRASAACTVEREENRGDGTERQPEAWRERGVRIEQQDREQRAGQHVGCRRRAAKEISGAGRDEHRQRALRRNGESGEDRVRSSRDHTAHACHVRTRCARRDRPQAPEKRPGEHAERRDHRDVQAGDGDQVSGARSRKHPPLRLGNAGRLPHGEADEHPGCRRIGEDRLHAQSDRFARPQHREVPPGRGNERVALRVAHVTGGADRLAQQLALVVEAAGIGKCARLAQLHLQQPSFPGARLAR